jgi:hypothetical protein
VTSLTLSGPGVRVELVPGEGGRVQHLLDLYSGRELLYQRKPPPGDRTDFMSGCSGGWDELFPNDSPWGDHPDHGRLWSTPFEVIEYSGSTAALHGEIADPAVGVERRYRLLPRPRRGLRIETTVRALRDTGPFLWASHPMLQVGQGWRIDLPSGVLESDAELPGRFLAGATLGLDDRVRALVVPAANEGWAEVLYVSAVSWASVGSADAISLTRVSWDEAFLRHLWIVTVTGDLDLDLCLLFEPSTTRPYRLEEAIGLRENARLPTGRARTWWTEVESLDAS